MRVGSTLVMLIVAGAACDLPTEPTEVTLDADRPSPPVSGPPVILTRPLDLASVHPLFEDLFWREIIYDEFDAPGTSNTFPNTWFSFTRPFVTTSPNFYLVMNEHLTPARRARVRLHLPEGVEALTGQPYRGRFSEGPPIDYDAGERTPHGWIEVEFSTDTQLCEGVGGLGGQSWDGTTASITMCPGSYDSLGILMHELGHAMGLSHTNHSSTTDVMSYGSGDLARFSDREMYHSQLLYQVGFGKPYCGWPFSAECENSPREPSVLSRKYAPQYAPPCR